MIYTCEWYLYMCECGCAQMYIARNVKRNVKRVRNYTQRIKTIALVKLALFVSSVFIANIGSFACVHKYKS